MEVHGTGHVIVHAGGVAEEARVVKSGEEGRSDDSEKRIFGD